MALSFYERLIKLKEFGLTEYQARAYLALLELNVSTANQIPAVSRVPRTKIYGIMRQLHDKGLVQIIPETPLKYKAVPFSRYLERRVDQLKEEAEEVERSISSLSEAFKIKSHEPDEQGKFEMFYGRRNVRDKLRDMYSNAKKEIISIGNERSPGRIIRTSISIIEDLPPAGVKIKYGFPVNKENIEKVERLAKYAEIKHIERTPSMHFMIVDGAECMLVHRIPDDEDPVRGEDIAIWSNDNAIVSTLRDFGNDVFEASFDYKQFIDKLGHDLGVELAKKCKAKKLEPLLKEIQEFWEAHNLGKIEILKKKPVEMTMENNMDCNENPEIAQAICSFIKGLVGTILEEKLGVKCTVKEVDCRPERQTYCKFRINMK
jgi:sugar-specific transcriptional regulator TrmB